MIAFGLFSVARLAVGTGFHLSAWLVFPEIMAGTGFFLLFLSITSKRGPLLVVPL